MPSHGKRVWLFWDGSCGLCGAAVALFKRYDVKRRILVVPYQISPRPPMSDALAEACDAAIHVVIEDGEVLRAGRACIYLLGDCGWKRLGRALSCWPVIQLVETAYYLVARNRRLI